MKMQSHYKRMLSAILLWGASAVLFSCTPPPENYVVTVTGGENGTAVTPGRTLTFPQDHGEHPEFGIEWWYFTANLRDQHQQPLWLQWTLFRFRQSSAADINQPKADVAEQSWNNEQLYMAHASVHSSDNHYFQEKFARGGVGNAGVTMQPLTLFMDDWQYQSANNQLLAPGILQFTINDNAEVSLQLSSKRAPVLQGDGGFSLKYPGSKFASYYYSQPYLEVTGDITLEGQSQQVAGKGWFDHEWSSQVLDERFNGWDWFSMHLEDNQKLMLFTLNSSVKSLPAYWYGVLIDRDGVRHVLQDEQITVNPTAVISIGNRRFATQWDITLPEHGHRLTLSVMKEDQFIDATFSYYEGAVDIVGTSTGVGFVEMTGQE
ncbi:MAG: lipocalin-like domain-containing protein [Aestuariibacter sp.]